MNKFGRFGNNLSVLPQEYFSKRRSAAENTFENAAKNPQSSKRLLWGKSGTGVVGVHELE